MTRSFHVNGESLIKVKGGAGSAIANLSELGLSDAAVTITPVFQHDDIKVDAWGKAPPEIQMMLAYVNINFTLVHYDRDVLFACILESMASPIEGTLPHAGTLMGNGTPRFNVLNRYIGLNILSPNDGLPWRFFYTYLVGQPVTYPLGTERSVVQTAWRAIPYTQDPWNNGQGAFTSPLWDHNLDT